MRVIVWLTKRPGQNDNGTLLFDQRTRVIAVAMKRSRMRRILPSRYRNRRIARNAERTTRQTGDPTSTERAQRIRRREKEEEEDEEEERKGVTRREILIAIIISRREPRSLTAVELPLRVEAQIARNEFLMIILFPFLFLPPPHPPLFSRRRNLSRYTLHARLLSSRSRHVVRAFVVNNEWTFYCRRRTCLALSTISLCIPVAARGTQAGLPFCNGKKNALWSVLPAIMVRAGEQPIDVRREFDGAVLKDSTFRAFVHCKGIANLLLFRRGMSIS